MKKLIQLLLLLTLMISVGCKPEEIVPPVPEPEPIVDPYIEPVVKFGINLDSVKKIENRIFITLQPLEFTYNGSAMTLDIALFAGESPKVTGVVYVFPKIGTLPLNLQASAIMLNEAKIAKDVVYTFLDSKYNKGDDVFLNGLYVKQWKSKDGRTSILCFDGSIGEDGSIVINGAITVVYVNSTFYDMIIGKLVGGV